jgi:protein-disulfide isomerase
MANNQRSREKRREEREAAESKAQGADRRSNLLKLAAAGVFLAIIAVVVVIVIVSNNSSSGGDASNLVEKADVQKLIGSTPQNNNTLGKSSAPVKLYEYGDLQCSACKFYSEEILPELIEKQVRTGKATITFRNFTIIGPQSLPAGESFLAASAQNMGWTYLETWYRNQGPENGGYVTEDFVESMAKYVGIPNVAKFMQEWKSEKYKSTVEKTTEQANEFGFEATPSFAVEGPKTNGLKLLGTPQSTEAIEEAIEEAA